MSGDGSLRVRMRRRTKKHRLMAIARRSSLMRKLWVYRYTVQSDTPPGLHFSCDMAGALGGRGPDGESMLTMPARLGNEVVDYAVDINPPPNNPAAAAAAAAATHPPTHPPTV